MLHVDGGEGNSVVGDAGLCCCITDLAGSRVASGDRCRVGGDGLAETVVQRLRLCV